MGLVRRSIAAEGYHGDREARAQGSLAACYRELLGAVGDPRDSDEATGVPGVLENLLCPKPLFPTLSCLQVTRTSVSPS